MATNKLDIIGFSGSTFDWLNPQKGMDLIYGMRILTLAMYSRNYSNISPSRVESATSIYELLWLFKSMAESLFSRYIKQDMAIGDDISNFTSFGLSWEYLETATGEDLSFLEDLVYNEVSPALQGKLCDPHTLVILYKVLNQFQEYLALSGSSIKFDSYDNKWVNYVYDQGVPAGVDRFAKFEGRLDHSDNPISLMDRQALYDNLMSFINDPSNYGQYNGYDTNGTDISLIPSRIGVQYIAEEFLYTPLQYDFRVLGAPSTPNHSDRIALSYNFGYPGLNLNGGDNYSAGDFRNIFPDANTIYKQYLWGSKGNGSQWQADVYNDYGSGINELKLSYIQTAYSADGYILRTDSLPIDLSLVANVVNVNDGFMIEGIRSMNVNDERFTDYRTSSP